MHDNRWIHGLRHGLRGLLADVVVCLRFFSRIPVPDVPGIALTVPPVLTEAVGVLPIAGLVIGACGAVPLALAAAAGLPGGLAVLLGGATQLVATGGLHEDGLADTADGFGGGSNRERKLAIMRDSRIGTFGVLAVAMALLLRFGATTTIFDRFGPAGAVTALLAGAALSRALALLPSATLRPARSEGLGRSLGRPSQGALTMCSAIAALIGLALPVCSGVAPAHSVAACCCAVAAASAVTWLAHRHIGGHTGDVGGAAQQSSEVAYLIGLLAFPGYV